jgi:hypothetical protein
MRWGMIDINANFIIKPQYEFITNLYQGVAFYKSNNKWGLMDKNEQIIVKSIYTFVYPFSDEYSAVSKNFDIKH